MPRSSPGKSIPKRRQPGNLSIPDLVFRQMDLLLIVCTDDRGDPSD
ncbi:hypothetical protein LptCag_0750 [Leptospirillum ferriphilum]|uniref:Uncharacterized protein n=1 Tax=Leptospirillum ferriphilum TaxID=178606 RepID=A0A094X6E8_9BACT|nr:hypothetical protein LptCag_0750 [Leptospirillum ferriphilum]